MESANSLERMLQVVDLIEGSDAPVMPGDLMGQLGLTRSTLYRYLKILSDAGLITSFPGVGFALGPRIAELDFKMRNRDPLIIASRPVMSELVAAIPGIALLCRRYRDTVLCVHQERGAMGLVSTYERGLARPLFRGAASRIILAYLPPRVIERLHQQDRANGVSLASLRPELKEMRKRGWDLTESQVTRGVTGIAAPVFDNRGRVLGSLSLTLGRTKIPASEAARIAERVMFCARIVSTALPQAVTDI
jgi:DNA-binding IclR family transcriptional regulator